MVKLIKPEMKQLTDKELLVLAAKAIGLKPEERGSL